MDLRGSVEVIVTDNYRSLRRSRLPCGQRAHGRRRLVWAVNHWQAAVEDDFHPNAPVQNMVVGMFGYFTPVGLER